MNPDDPVCLCFHVTRRKVRSFIRVEKPKRPSQLSQCFGAGTGCGWCRPYLERMLTKASDGGNAPQRIKQTDSPEQTDSADSADLTIEEYKKARSQYVRDGGGTPPPGATPIDEQDNS